MTNTEQVLTIAEQYRAQLTDARDKDTIREKQEWYLQQAAPLFKPTGGQPSTNK